MNATELTTREILYALRCSNKWNLRSSIMVPNVSWGLLYYEADFVSCSSSGRLTEVEIKRSWSDYLADFKKNHHHDDSRVSYFYYCVPEVLVEKVADHLSKSPFDKNTGLLFYTEDKIIKTKWEAIMRKQSVKLTEKEMVDLGRLGSLRYWNLLKENLTDEKDEKIKELKSEINFLKSEFKAVTGFDIKESF